MDLSSIRKLSAALRFHGRYGAETEQQAALRRNTEREQAANLLDRLTMARAEVTALDLPRRRANVEALRSSARNASERWICDEFVRLFDTIEALNALLAEDGQ